MRFILKFVLVIALREMFKKRRNSLFPPFFSALGMGKACVASQYGTVCTRYLVQYCTWYCTVRTSKHLELLLPIADRREITQDLLPARS
jgi:hypothetical protein